jgi:hypothetical protein
MSSKKRNSGAGKRAPQAKKAAPPKRTGRPMWIVAGAAIAVIAGLIAFSSLGAGKGNAAPPEEQKYIGRLLPANYTEPKVANAQTYSSTVKMTKVTPAPGGSQLAIPLGDVVAKKIVSFEYRRADGQVVPMLAYVKPSGKLFVGVNFCLPCKGKGQRIESDGTLTCETCGTKRDLETGVGASGACKLYPLDEVAAAVAGGRILVDKTVIEKWTPQPLDRPSTGA